MAHNLSSQGFPSIPLTDGMIVKLEARAVTTDAAVTGVTSSLWAIYGDNLNPGDLLIADTIPAYTLEQV